MATELYDLTVPTFLRGLGAMAKFLEKGRAWADENGKPHRALLEARLFEDMIPLTAQVQRASDGAKLATSRLAGIEAPVMVDEEASFEELQQRIQRTIDFLKSVPREKVDGREEADIELRAGARTFAFKGLGYQLHFAIPNFYFHVTTAYDILRHQGVPLGKMDYLGGA